MAGAAGSSPPTSVAAPTANATTTSADMHATRRTAEPRKHGSGYAKLCSGVTATAAETAATRPRPFTCIRRCAATTAEPNPNTASRSAAHATAAETRHERTTSLEPTHGEGAATDRGQGASARRHAAIREKNSLVRGSAERRIPCGASLSQRPPNGPRPDERSGRKP